MTEARSARILVVEDKASLRELLTESLAGEGFEVEAAATAEDGIASLRDGRFDLVLTDLKLPAASGLEVVSVARSLQPPVPAVVMTAFGTIPTAVEAMRRGATDFLEKPVELGALFALARRILRPAERLEVVTIPGAPPLVGSDPRFLAAIRLLRRVAPTDSTVLLTGQSGTGKELFARALHALSERRDGPFVAVNCAAIPETLVESELFGHEKGAFTGADRRHHGRFEQAAGGTLLLDEIGELPASVQSKILRVLEEKRFERVGGETSLRADVRLVGATNRELEAMAESGEFRQDLFYRLAVFPIHLPALAERPDDVPLLAEHLAERIAERHGVAAIRLDTSAIEWLRGHPWPGNVRELANLLERASIVRPGEEWSGAALEELAAAGAGGRRRQVEEALRATDGDKHRAAARLGISYRTLQRRIREYGLEGYPKYRDESGEPGG